MLFAGADAAVAQSNPATGVSSAVKHFQITTSMIVNDTLAVTGVGFQPQAALFFWNGRSEAVNTVGQQTDWRGLGFCASPTDRRAGVSSDRVNGGTVWRRINTGIVCGSTSAGVGDPSNDGILDLESWDADGFTVKVDEVFTRDLRIMAVLFGGDSITNAKTGSYNEPGATGPHAVTGVGFQGDMAFFSIVSQTATDDPDQESGHSLFNFGAAASANHRAVHGSIGTDASEPSNNYNHARSGECIIFNGGASGIIYRSNFTSFNADGFTLNCTERASSRLVDCLVIKGGEWTVGATATRTDTTAFNVSLPINPKSILFMSANMVESATDTQDTGNNRFSVGAYDVAAETQMAMQSIEIDNVTPHDVATAVNFNNVYLHVDSTKAIVGSMAVTEVSTSAPHTMTLQMTDADPSAMFVWYIAVGDVAVKRRDTRSIAAIMRARRHRKKR
jgi:hypothetical protein